MRKWSLASHNMNKQSKLADIRKTKVEDETQKQKTINNSDYF